MFFNKTGLLYLYWIRILTQAVPELPIRPQCAGPDSGSVFVNTSACVSGAERTWHRVCVGVFEALQLLRLSSARERDTRPREGTNCERKYHGRAVKEEAECGAAPTTSRRFWTGAIKYRNDPTLQCNCGGTATWHFQTPEQVNVSRNELKMSNSMVISAPHDGPAGHIISHTNEPSEIELWRKALPLVFSTQYQRLCYWQ